MANIALVEDHVVLRQGLALLIKELGNKVIFEADNGEDCINKFKGSHTIPDIVIMDINMPVMDGFDTALYIREHHPGIKVLALSMVDDEAAIIRMLRNGARGYILKNCTPQQLADAIHSLMTRGYYHSELVSSKLIHAINNYDDKGSEIKKVLSLNEKELAFLKLAATELTYKEIAHQMKASPRTIDSYRENLFDRLSIKSRVGLVIYAIKNKIVSL